MVRSGFCALLLLLVWPVLATQQQCRVQANQVCELQLAEGKKPLRLEFVTHAVARDEIVIRQIKLHHGGDKTQALSVADMTPVFSDDSIPLYGRDLNGDGYTDIWLVTDRGSANSYALYWLFDPAKQSFVPLGRHPWLSLQQDGSLKAWERHGHAGRIYTKSRYRLEAMQLRLVEQEKQQWDASKERYVKKILRPDQ